MVCLLFTSILFQRESEARCTWLPPLSDTRYSSVLEEPKLSESKRSWLEAHGPGSMAGGGLRHLVGAGKGPGLTSGAFCLGPRDCSEGLEAKVSVVPQGRSHLG